MDLAHQVGVSPRHLSFVETGRSRPSPELVLDLARHLEVPLRERNALLLAAGHAPRFSHRALDDPAMDGVRRAVQRMLDAHDPYPGVALDRQWNVVMANAAASALTAGLPDALRGPPLNIYRACLHPDGLARMTVNFREWAGYLLEQLRRSIALSGDPGLRALAEEVRSYPDVAAIADRSGGVEQEEPVLLVPLRLRSGGVDLSLFTTLTTFGAPRDATLDDLAVELFFPADRATDEVLSAVRPADDVVAEVGVATPAPPGGIDAFLARPVVCHLATSGPTVRPVWFLWEDGCFWVLSGPWSALPGRVTADPAVALVVDSCDLRSGEVVQVAAKGRAQQVAFDVGRGARLLARYLGPDQGAWDPRFRSYLGGASGAVWIRIPPRQIRMVDLSYVPPRVLPPT